MERDSDTPGDGPHAEKAPAEHASELLELGDAFLELGPDWRVLRVNRRQEELSRKPRAETVGRVFWEVWPETASPGSGYWREYHRCMRDRVPVQFEAHYGPLDLWTGVTAYPVSGRGIAVFFRDITDRMRAEQALRESEERFRSVLENMSEGVMLFDAAANLTYQNPASLRIHGFGARADGRIPHDDLAATWNAWDERGRPISFEEWPVSRVFRGERFQEQVLRVERVETGHVFHGSYNGAPLRRDDHGKVVLGFITIRELTGEVRADAERRRAEHALSRSEQRLRAIFEGAAVGIVEVDEEDRFVSVNGRFCEMLGYRREELLGKRPHDITAPEDLAATTELNARGHAGEVDRFDYEKRYVRKDGSRLWVHVTVSVVRDDAGRYLRSVGTAEDVSDRRRADEGIREVNEKLREADRRKDEFLGMLSHELRNPLAPIRNALYILDHVQSDGQQARRAKEIVARQVSHLTRLVDDLLDVTRIARGKIELRHEDLDLAALARRTAEDYRALVQGRGLELAVDVPRAPVLVNGDPARLTQVLGNLLNNAAKFTPAGGEVTLSLRSQDGRVAVRVRDTGPGIAPEVLPTIFEPFVQGKQTLARSEGGLGLGLSLVKGLVALHGGEVAVASGAAGRGTEFVVTLPVARGASDAAEVAQRASLAPSGDAKRVLVVDDNRDAADTLAELVEMLGHVPVVAYDAFAALERASESHPDLVLCDIGLPGMDGYEFARRFRARASPQHTRLVALSGYAQPEDVARALQAGFDAHVAKPVDPPKIERLLAGPLP